MVPEGWIPTTLEHIAEPRTGLQTGPFGSQLKASEYADEGIPVIMPKDIRDGRVVDDTAARVSESTAASLHKHRCEVGDILFGRRGDIGRCAVITSKERGWLCGTGCLRARPRAGTVDADFLTQQLRQQSIAAWLTEHAVGQTMLNLNTSILGALPLLLPPLPEQRKIAAILSSVDEAIEKTQAVIDQVQVVRKGLMQELLTRGLPGRHTKFKQTEIGEIPDDWEVVELGEVLTSIDAGWSPLCDNRPAREGEWGVLKVSCVSSGTFRPEENKRLTDGLEPRPDISVNTGDLLVSRANTKELVGRAAIVERPTPHLMMSDKLLRLRPNPNRSIGAYLNLVLGTDAARTQIEDRATGSSGSMKNISQAKLRTVVIPLPSVAEQNSLVGTYASMNARTSAERRCVAELRALKSALMSVLLTGEVRVKVDPEATA